MKKICTKCKLEKEEIYFYFRNKDKNIRRNVCKTCCEQHRKSKEHYQKYKTEYNKRSKERRERLFEENSLLVVNFLKNNPCVNCSESNILVLDFDHKDKKDKKYDISRMLSSYKWNTILKEIKKCQVLCANCHRIKTAHQFDWYKLKYL